MAVGDEGVGTLTLPNVDNLDPFHHEMQQMCEMRQCRDLLHVTRCIPHLRRHAIGRLCGENSRTTFLFRVGATGNRIKDGMANAASSAALVILANLHETLLEDMVYTLD